MRILPILKIDLTLSHIAPLVTVLDSGLSWKLRAPSPGPDLSVGLPNLPAASRIPPVTPDGLQKSLLLHHHLGAYQWLSRLKIKR